MRFFRFFQIAALILIAAGAQPAYTAVYEWSTTAANNASADPSINWSEGMSPSSVNDSARAMMAAVAVARRDWQAHTAAGGTASAITFTSNQGFSSFAALEGQMITFVASATNAAGATLNVDGLGPKPITVDGGLPVPAGALVSGTPYAVTYYNSVNQFRAWSFYGNPYSIPLGGLMPYTGTTAPNSNFILPAGQCISTTTYAAYWALVGSPASGACPGGQFAVLDLRGKVPAALDNLNGTAANLMTSSGTGCGTAFNVVGAICANGNQTQSLAPTNLPSITSSNNAQLISVRSVNGDVVRSPSGILDAQTATGTPNSRVMAGSTAAGTQITSSDSNAISVTSTGTNGTPFPRIQPTIGVTYLLRVI